jgi:catechol 2,3-dioxygenase-like lactoylglutathione lyase family enzyme
LIVERTDFISVPVTDMERAKRFYEDTLGLPRISERGFPEYQLGENVSVYLIRMEDVGAAWGGPHSAHVALRVADVAEGDILDTSVCHMAFFKDPDGNQFMLHRRYAPRES